MTLIERSPGLAIGGTGLRAGGGVRGLTERLDGLVQRSAEALSALYGDAPVTIRFNGDRLSGGVWLKTVEPDYIGGNAEVGITASISPDDLHAEPSMAVSMRRLARAEGDWEDEYAEREDAAVESVEEAVEFLREHAVTDFGVLTDRLDALVKMKKRGH